MNKFTLQRRTRLIFLVAMAMTGICITALLVLLQQMRDDADVIDVMGRQRMLSQSMASGLLEELVKQQAKNADGTVMAGMGYPQAHAIFSQTLQALRQGGVYSRDLEQRQQARITRLTDPAMSAQLAVIAEALRQLDATAQQLHTNPSDWRISIEVLNQAGQLRDLSDGLVQHYTTAAKTRQSYLLAAVIITGAMTLLAFTMIYLFANESLLAPLRRILGGDEDIARYEAAEWQRRKMEVELRESEARFRRLVEVSAEGVLLHDQGTVLDCNPALAAMTGYSVDELIGMNVLHLAAPESRELVQAKINDGFQGVYEAVGQRKNGSIFPIEVRVNLTPYQKRTMQVVVMRDLTDHKQREAQRLAAAEAHRVTLIREVHHRIKNTLQGVAGLLRQKIQSHAATREPLEEAVAQLCSVAVVMGLESMDRPQEVNLCNLIRALKKSAEELFGRQIILECPVAEENSLLLAVKESVPIALILNELIINAVKHSVPDAAVSIAIAIAIAGEGGAAVSIKLSNQSKHDNLRVDWAQGQGLGTGLTLIKSLMPPKGAVLQLSEAAGVMTTHLRLEAPVLLSLSSLVDEARLVGVK
ncbi:MAG: PAS domain S-box protein [Gammaproteobacteria bacterium]|nr:PAS domain S-box protein [Gammaproteobacteria bacterium]